MWDSVKLGEVCTFQNGRAFKKSEWSETGLPIIRIQNLKKVETEHNFFDGEYDARIFVRNGDLLLSWSGTIKPFIWCHDDALLNQHVFKVSVSKSLDQAYAYHLLNNILDEISKHKVGLGLQHITKNTFDNFEIILPPLKEQERIVAKLDAAFAEIDRAVEAVKKNIQNSKRYYSYAIDNEFSKYSDKTKSIGEHSKINYGHTAKASFEKGRYKFLRITDIQDNAVDWNSVPYCEVETKKLPSVLLNDGDIVFARTGATTGKSFLVENPVDSVFASYLIRVSIDKKVFLPKYVMHYFQSAAYWQQVNEGISGAAQGGFNATKLRELRIPIINKTEQLEVVQKLDLINEQSASLQNTYALKMHALNSLKSAILSKELQSSEAA